MLTGGQLDGQDAAVVGARIGTEVKAFLDLGAVAIGIDLNPGENNRYVVYGDFHDLQFASGSIDVVGRLYRRRSQSATAARKPIVPAMGG